MPSWNADQAEVAFWYIPESDELDFEGRGWNEYLEAWRKLITPAWRFTKIEGVVCTLEDLTARDYVESDQLDLDHLSSREG